MSYKLSFKAKNDFKGIYNYTFKKFGEEQAKKYTSSLEKCFFLIAETPKIGRDVSHIKKGVFRHEHQSHTVFYRIKKEYIFIVRLLHEDMNISKYL